MCPDSWHRSSYTTETIRRSATKRTQRPKYITMNMKTLILAVAGACLLALTTNANTITYVTPTGSTVGSPAQSVDAYATFATGAGTVTITIGDLLPNPTDVAQLISDLSFTLSSGQTSGTLGSMSGTEINVNNGGTTSGQTSVTSSHWTISGLHLTTLVGGQPSDLIIGPPGTSGYSNANGSIAGNGPHNPFLTGTATFVVDVTGVTGDSKVDSATFSFGTTAGVDVPGTPGSPPQSIPDGGTTAVLLGAALSTFGLMRRKLS